MSLKSRIFSKDTRKSSLNLRNNLHHSIKKLCKDNPITLGQLKVEYDRYFKDKISTKSHEVVTSVLKSLEEDVKAVKVYIQIDNREMTDTLLGLRNAPYASKMVHEDNPAVSKDRLLHIIREQGALGIHVRDLENRYMMLFNTRPSFLPFKSIKELLHRTPDVELASSGKNLRVRTRQTAPVLLKKVSTKIPSLCRNSFVSSSLKQARRSQDVMSMSICRQSDAGLRRHHNNEMTRSVFIPSSSSEEGSASSSGSVSPSGSIDMGVSMILPGSVQKKDVINSVELYRQNKEVMATLLKDVPPEGTPLKTLTEEFLNLIGSNALGAMTTVEFLIKEFKDIVKIEDDPSSTGLRVYKVNSPLLPRRTVADVYTKLALQSNRKPSDRVLKILRDIYKKRDDESLCDASSPPQIKNVAPVNHLQRSSLHREKEEAVVQELKDRLSSSRLSSRIPVRKQTKDQVIEQLERRLKEGPVDYPNEFQELTKEVVDDTQSFLVQLMSSLNLCLKPLNGKMVLHMN